MAHKSLSDEKKACGSFLVNFLNSRLNPEDISILAKECLNTMRHYLRYNNPKWDDLTVEKSFSELIEKSVNGYFREFIVPYMKYQFLGGYHSERDRIYSEYRKSILQKLKIELLKTRNKSWGEINKSLHPDFMFYIDIVFNRKNFKHVINEIIIDGKELENLFQDKFFCDFLKGVESEYSEICSQVIIDKNKTMVQPVMTEISVTAG